MKIDEAFALKKRHPEHLLAGERKGIKVKGFDMGNSPHEASRLNLAGRGVLLSTSGGTRAIRCMERADRILIGSFGNAHALLENLRRSETSVVTWLAVGTEGTSRAVEDDLCAEYLQGIAEGKRRNCNAMIRKIMDGEGADRLRRLGQDDDFPYCLTLNLYDLVPELQKNEPLNGFVINDRLR